MPSPPARLHVALVLHAHLPWVRHPEHPRSLEERWLHEGVLDCYAPLVGLLARLRRDGLRAPLTLSVSPTLVAMLREPELAARTRSHGERLLALASWHLARAQRSPERAPFAPALRAHAARIAEALALLDATENDLVHALVSLHTAEAIELATTTATHGLLPALSPMAQRAQCELGARVFQARTGLSPTTRWLPECALGPHVAKALAASGAGASVVDAHGLLLARPAPPNALSAPLLDPCGLAWFGRHPLGVEAVWSPRTGYPGHPAYAERHLDLADVVPFDELGDERGPFGARVPTGLRLHRVTRRGAPLARTPRDPWNPLVAAAQAEAHAGDLVARLEALAELPRTTSAPPVVTLAFDAELFGHHWLEGIAFLDALLRRLASHTAMRPVSLSEHVAAHPHLFVGEPATSSWGKGGFFSPWTSERARRVWPTVHRADELVRSGLAKPPSSALAEQARLPLVCQWLLLQASDWPFLLDRGDFVSYAEGRVRDHANAVELLSRVARGERTDAEAAARVQELSERDGLLDGVPRAAVEAALGASRAPA